MRVVHISTSISESSANTKLHKALLKSGIDSNVLVFSHSGEIDHVYDLNLTEVRTNLYEKIENRLKKIVVKKRKADAQIYKDLPFSFGDVGMDLHKIKLIKSADIIHLHWICGFLSLKTIQKLLRLGKPVVWTCHDSWPFTGGCHVRYGCKRFEQNCGMCRMFEVKKERDASYYVLKEKKRRWRGNHIVFVAPSRWMEENIKASTLFQKNRVICIPNAIDTDIFAPISEEKIEQTLGYKRQKDKIHILFGAGDAKLPFKGYQYLLEVLKKLAERNSIYLKNIVVHIIGAEKDESGILSKFESKFWGYIKGQDKMVCLYNLADIFIYPSIDDNLPNMVMESLACETPVVAFETGGIPDMIVHKENGFLASYKDTDDLLNGILWVIENNTDNILGENARRRILAQYSEKVIAERHIELYRDLIGENCK